MIISTKNIQNAVPESAPEAMSGSSKCKNFLREHVLRPSRDHVLTHTEIGLTPLDLILACCAPPPPGNLLNEGLLYTDVACTGYTALDYYKPNS